MNWSMVAPGGIKRADYRPGGPLGGSTAFEISERGKQDLLPFCYLVTFSPTVKGESRIFLSTLQSIENDSYILFLHTNSFNLERLHSFGSNPTSSSSTRFPREY